ncbi:response regulator transcription factor [Pararhodobacter aggregans]|uniref:DNA-binding response regulator n=1 Tax=Pararhodobacter aggregans TaxID=404875 RepID=A0A2T7UMH1_9RHOB|nr:response regulator transcription factor [Pararhodobacter aggregans]PTW99146.1 LuxR family two component transcriptional regulator [Pararhodobacter aggregans]PVE45867.1 DNA-binding response regulator [Pararhodobacter aggregans]
MTASDKGATILCVEDEAALLEELRDELAGAGHCVLTAASGDEAEAILATVTPDIVLCDVILPGRSGFVLLQDLRRAGKVNAATAFLFVTALSDRESHLEGLRAGATDYITKPIDLDQLHLKIANLLAHARCLRAQTEPRIELPPAHLSRREQQVLGLLGRGIRTVEIAFELQISEHTVNQYIKDIYRKLGLGNRADAARAAIALGLLD